jgi:hypothetical protein
MSFAFWQGIAILSQILMGLFWKITVKEVMYA